jgi:hypothetical protein
MSATAVAPIPPAASFPVAAPPSYPAAFSPTAAPTDGHDGDLYCHDKSLQRHLEFVEIMEEYVKDELRNLRREELRGAEEVKRCRATPLEIGQFMEMVDADHGIVAPTTTCGSSAPSTASCSSPRRPSRCTATPTRSSTCCRPRPTPAFRCSALRRSPTSPTV